MGRQSKMLSDCKGNAAQGSPGWVDVRPRRMKRRGLTRLARGRFVHREGADYLLDDGIALGANLLVGGILNRMRHKDPRRLGQAQR